MTYGTVTQPLHHWVVFFTSYIGVHLAEQLERPVKPTGAVLGDIHRRMIVQVLAIINGGMLD